MKRDDILDLTIGKTGFEGKSIARLDDFVVFVEGGVPGDIVRAQVYKKKKNFAEAKILEVLERSAHRVLPQCKHFGVCGGCKWQQLEYGEQLKWKREHVIDSFERIGGVTNVVVHPTLPSPNMFYYRNKMEYTFGEKRWRLPNESEGAFHEDAFTVGLHVPMRYDKILHIDACWLQSEQSNALLAFTRAYFLDREHTAYSTKTYSGDLRHVVIREAKKTGESMLFLITTNTPKETVEDFGEQLQRAFPPLTTYVHGWTRRKSLVAIAEEEHVVFGPGKIREQLGDCTYEISPMSFFQANTLQAERLYEVAMQFTEPKPENVVWDLYCGIGTITLFIAPHVQSVLGIESNSDAIRDAHRNAESNAIHNVEFQCDDILPFLKRKEHRSAPDVIILDPPRAGLHPEVVAEIGMSEVKRLVYVSCNPATCARDVKLFAEHGFSVIEVQPVDMFPHTYHIECVVKLQR